MASVVPGIVVPDQVRFRPDEGGDTIAHRRKAAGPEIQSRRTIVRGVLVVARDSRQTRHIAAVLEERIVVIGVAGELVLKRGAHPWRELMTPLGIEVHT